MIGMVPDFLQGADGGSKITASGQCMSEVVASTLVSQLFSCHRSLLAILPSESLHRAIDLNHEVLRSEGSCPISANGHSAQSDGQR
jgi:hypothetical protein